MISFKTWLVLGALLPLASRGHAQDDFADEVSTPIEDPVTDPGPPPAASAEFDLEQERATAAPRLPAAEEEPEATITQEEARPSATESGGKIFDWSKHQDETEVAHPFAEKGLIRIDKNRVYHYRVEETETKHAIDLHVGPFNPTQLSNPDDGGPYSFYEDNYNGGAPAVMVTYEWQLWRAALGKFGLRAGGGLFFSQGNGHFVHLNDLKPLEVFSFIAIPINLGAVYRFQWWHRQLFVPYGEGGATLWAFAETRDDGKRPKFGGSASAYFAGGVAMNLTYFNALSRIALDREYGIHAVYLIAEYRRTQALSPRFDFSANYINGGLLMEF